MPVSSLSQADQETYTYTSESSGQQYSPYTAGIAKPTSHPETCKRSQEIDKQVEDAFMKSRFPPLPGLGIFILGSISIGTTVAAPVLLSLYGKNTPHWAKVGFATFAALIVISSLPSWLVVLLWKKPKILTSSFNAPPVDILLTTYKEHLDEIAGTLAAIGNIEYDGVLNVYVLDDANRYDVRQLVEEVQGVSKVSARSVFKYRVQHITRPTNVGKKGGNLNHFLKKVPRTAEFFITLDCDMRPFPNMITTLFSQYFSYGIDQRQKIAFIQSPQWFRNTNMSDDAYDVNLMHFIKTVMPALDRISTVPYIGTSALWRREAIETSGYFNEAHVTEDCSSGIAVHRNKWISQYCPVPVAAGLSPRGLPELIDQRLRWNTGLCQLAFSNGMFVFASGLTPLQRFAYFATCGGWAMNLVLYISVLGGTLFTNWLIFFSAVSPSKVYAPAWFIFVTPAFILPMVCYLLLPGATMMMRLRGIQMAFIYTSTQIVALLYCFGIPVSIKPAAESATGRRWHPHFWMHAITYAIVLASGLVGVVAQWRNGLRDLIPYAQVVVLFGTWTIALTPIMKSLRNYQAIEDTLWLELETGRNQIFDRPVFSEVDTTAVAQMKDLMIDLADRVGEQERRTNSESGSNSRVNSDFAESMMHCCSSASVVESSASSKLIPNMSPRTRMRSETNDDLIVPMHCKLGLL